MLETISGYPPFGGSEGKGMGEGSSGLESQLRLQEAAQPGMAVSLESTATNASNRNVWKFGNASARPEFYGVLVTKGAAPSLTLAVTDTNSNDVSVVWCGYAPVLIAPGYTVKPGMALEPINGGANQALFRPASGGRGVAVALDYLDNSGGSAGVWVGASIIGNLQAASGLVGAVGPSANLVGVTVETAYGLPAAATVTIPAYSLRLGDRIRFVGAVLANNIAAGNNVVKGYINGIGTSAFFTAPAVTFAASDVVSFQVDGYVAAASGSNNLSLSGFVAAGTPGTATARAVVGVATLDLTANQVVTIANTPNNVLDSSKLLFLSVERLG